MGRTRNVLLSLACLVPSAGPSFAAEAFGPPAGTRIRVTAPEISKRRLTGTLLEASEREVVIALSSTERKAVPLGAVTRLERSRGRHGHPIPGAIVGAVVGGAFFAFASLAVCDAASCSPSMEVFLLGTALGALPGAGIGALVRTERWEDASPARVRVTVAPARGGGIATSLRVSF